MLRRALAPTLVLTFAVVTAAIASPANTTCPSCDGGTSAARKQPPWVSIESPANPYDPTTKNAAFLVHALLRENTPATREVVGTAEGLVGGARKSISLRLDATSQPGVFAVTKQWPSEGTWLLRISLNNTSALVTVDKSGNIGTVTVPTTPATGSSMLLPRAVTAREIDAMLASAARQ
jgi:hypothetical protein